MLSATRYNPSEVCRATALFVGASYGVRQSTMRIRLQLVALVVAASCCASAAHAQSPMRISGPISISGPPGTRVIRIPAVQTASQPAVTSLPSASSSVAGASSSVETLLNGNYPVPGFGFDYTHHAAVNRDLATRALIDPVTQAQLNLARQIRRETPLTPVGSVIFNSTQVVVVPQPPIVIIQEAQQPVEPPVRIEPTRYTAPEPSSVPATVVNEPQRDLTEIVFIRRNGSLVFAIAYTASTDRITYVTRDGLRRTLLLTELDHDATVNFNEERGTSLRLPG